MRQGDDDLKSDFENLLAGGTVDKRVDERVDFRRLMCNTEVIWSLLLATGHAASLVERGFAPERIRRHGFAFRGKEVLVG